MTYLLDTNTFIEAKNRYYTMDICPGYWDWILHANKINVVASIEFVKQELIIGKDTLAKWVEEHPDLFIPQSDPKTQEFYSKIVNYVQGLSDFEQKAKDDFLKGADPWLIAKAGANSATIVTHEKYDKNIKKRIKIPNVCEHYEINCINTFELLHKLNVQFVLS